MQIPKRKSEQNVRHTQPDRFMTPEKYAELVAKLDRMENYSQPKLANEVKRLAEFGDFSENAAYQIAKGKLRGLNNRILKTRVLIDHAEIIQPNKNTDQVEMGHEVTIEINGKEKTYRLLGFHETNPSAGIISTTSPLGASMIGKEVGDEVTVDMGIGKQIEYTIKKIQ
ncbi:hypothetical protein COT97_04195 [Candidatus Falkowbacteria bacterium CG10_big_fil_rev_8_21_14_0_10_39_11]|uniref:Transcription elongation factor GreA n=1 Tax=Candidatus Falkowbacteria bacterium CG10_big_fil_rev_8_21_14_0_10_39_11 TaxID=1974565 RepID=A0A2H0V474_9BACT|nr:MAG: hypothetical protein COT97_04195 [Candidatus Falkowbacteria bacterium CG10_big_fil_rev_8_21_14_0_10_39_11]